MNHSKFRLFLSLLFTVASAKAAVSITGVADKSKNTNTVTYTVVADTVPGTTTTATLNGVPTTVGSAVVLTSVRYHELYAESRDAGGALVSSQLVRFIITNSARGGSEDGIPSHTPYKTVQDAPSAFVGKTFKVIAPSAFPVGMSVPMAFKLVDGSNETVRLNGIVAMSGFPSTKVQMRRGWGSVNAPAATAAGTVNVNAVLNGLTANPAINFEAAPTFTAVSGTISSNTAWPAHSRIHVTGGLTVSPGVTLTVGEGTVVKVYTGTATNGSAAEIRVDGIMNVNGTEANPVVFCPDTPGQLWGGIELRNAAAQLNAQWAFFTGSGEDDNWFGNNPGIGGSTHQNEQVLFLVAGAGTAPGIGAQLHLTDCFCIDNQQIMNSRNNTWIDLSRTLYQRAITSGELNNSKVTIDRSALIEFPSETGNFVDDDNDGLYLTAGDLSVTNTVIGFTKDDGIDSGGSGGASPFNTVDPDSGTTTTRFDSTNNWYEGTYHEGNSLSGQRNVYFTNCVFMNCGQGVEAGYSNSGTSDGPHTKVNGCLFTSNMVGVRWGDNYGSGYSYNAAAEVKNSIILNSFFRDAFSGQWHPTQSNAWIYQTTNLNSFGNPYFNVHDNLISQPDSRHPANTTWNPANPAHAAQLAAFMPVPGSNVGIGISTYQTATDTANYAGTFTVRLSTFSSNVVSCGWAVFGKTDAASESETTLASGTLTFQPGETIKTFTASVPTPGNYGLLRVALGNAVNGEITGEQVYVKAPAGTPSTLVARGSGGWRYRETRNDPPSTWKTLAFDDVSPAATEWLPATLPAGYGFTVNTTVASGPNNDRTKTFYFRKKFTISDKSLYTAFNFSWRRDDAIIAWINDDPTPIAMDGGLTAAATYSTLASNATDTTTYFSAVIPAAKLVNGENILAIEVHQTSITSGDLLLDCDVTGVPVPAPTPPLVLNFSKTGGQPVLYWFGSGDILERSYDLINWYPAPVSGSPVSITPSVPQEFFRLRR